MPNDFNEHDELDLLSPDIRAAFHEYPRPKASEGFDARFWSELDTRQNRYRGFVGFWRRLLEVEIEGVAVWRLGLSTLGGSGTFALGFALLGAFSAPYAKISSSPALPLPSVPTASPLYARELWDDTLRLEHQSKPPIRSNPLQGGVSCLNLNAGWA